MFTAIKLGSCDFHMQCNQGPLLGAAVYSDLLINSEGVSLMLVNQKTESMSQGFCA